MSRFFLAAYRWAWTLALPPVSLLAGADRLLRARTGKGLFPGTWRVTERIQAGRGVAGGGDGIPAPARWLWLHCASLGEAKGLWAFALSLAEGRGEGVAEDGSGPDLRLILTATTADGAGFLERQCAAFATAKGEDGARLQACIAPLDHPAVVRRFLEQRRVRGLCLYETELWPHYLSACRGQGLPVALVSGRMTEKAARRYRRFGGAGARLWDGLAWIQAQSPSDGERFRSLTRTEVVAGFDFKAAHYLRERDSPGPAQADRGGPATAGPAPADALPRFAFVSLHFAELIRLRPGFPALMERFAVTVFPRRMQEVERFRSVLEPLGFETHGRNPGARHLLVDSLGLVEPLLRDCASALVGGSLVPSGCHNLWEPLLAGLEIRIGPAYENQRPLAEFLLERGIARVLRDPARIGECLPPRPETAHACADAVETLRRGLESALEDGGRRIFATFYGEANVRTAAEAQA